MSLTKVSKAMCLDTYDRPDITTKDITYYVNGTTGNDSNDGLSLQTAFATIQKAVNQAPQIILHNFAVQVAAGTYFEDVVIPELNWNASTTSTGSENRGSFILTGDDNTPSNVKVNSFYYVGGTIGPSFVGFEMQSQVPYINESASIAFYGSGYEGGARLITFASGALGILGYGGCQVELRDIDVNNLSESAIRAKRGSTINARNTSGTISNVVIYRALEGGRINYWNNSATSTLTSRKDYPSDGSIIFDQDTQTLYVGILTYTAVIKTSPSLRSFVLNLNQNATIPDFRDNTYAIQIGSLGNIFAETSPTITSNILIGNSPVWQYQTDGAGSGISINDDINFFTVANGTAGNSATLLSQLLIENAGNIKSTAIYNNTTGSAANVFVDSNGLLSRSTSSIKYKTNIEPLENNYADAILNLKPVWYRSTSKNDNPNWSWYGFIAEDVAKIEPRLVHFKTYEVKTNEEGKRVETKLQQPIAESVAYDRIVPHLVNIIKRQKNEIEEIKQRLMALENLNGDQNGA